MWTKADLFRECARKASEATSTQALGEHTYAAVWSALRNWLVALFARCRGANFPTFARIAWHRVNNAHDSGQPSLRPIFVPSDCYLRTHSLHAASGVMRASSVVVTDLEPCEDFSAMKLAIKYSCSLNKEVVFSCSRHLLHQLGEALHSGRRVSVDLGVGTLFGGDKALSFKFNSQYLVHWPGTAAAAAAAVKPTSQQQWPQQQQHLRSGHRSQATISHRPTEQHQPPLLQPHGQQLATEGSAAGWEAPQPLPGSGRFASGDAGASRAEVAEARYSDPVVVVDLRHVSGPSSPGRPSQGQHPAAAAVGEMSGRGVRASPRPSTQVPAAGAQQRPAWGVRVPPASPRRGSMYSDASSLDGTRRHLPATNDGRMAATCYMADTGSSGGVLAAAAGSGSPRPLSYAGAPGTLTNATTADAIEAMPIARTIQLALRAPRLRPISASPPPATNRAMQQASAGPAARSRAVSAPRRVGQPSRSVNVAETNVPRPTDAPRHAWPLSARGLHPQTAIHLATSEQPSADVAALPAPPVAKRLTGGGWGTPGGGASPRPAWGAGQATRSHTAAGAGPAVIGGAAGSDRGNNNARANSAPRLRPAGVVAGATVEVGVSGRLAATDSDEQDHVPWRSSGAGGDVGALWSPDSNLATAAHSIAARLYGDHRRIASGGAPPEAGYGGRMQPEPRGPPSVPPGWHPLPLADLSGSDARRREVSAAVGPEQPTSPVLHHPRARKPLFTSPQKGTDDTEAARQRQRPAQRADSQRQQHRHAPRHGSKPGERSMGHDAYSSDDQRTDEQRDYTPGLRRDQRVKERTPLGPSRGGGVGSDSGVQVFYVPTVRTLSPGPGEKMPHCNLRYGGHSPGRANVGPGEAGGSRMIGEGRGAAQPRDDCTVAYGSVARPAGPGVGARNYARGADVPSFDGIEIEYSVDAGASCEDWCSGVEARPGNQILRMGPGYPLPVFGTE